MDEYPYDLGPYTRKITSTNPAAQLWFVRGLNWCFGFHHSDERAWVLAKMTPHPLGAFVQGIRLTGAHARVPKYIAVFAEGGWFGARFADKCRAKRGWDVRFMQGGHSLMIDDAEGVAAILTEAAA